MYTTGKSVPLSLESDTDAPDSASTGTTGTESGGGGGGAACFIAAASQAVVSDSGSGLLLIWAALSLLIGGFLRGSVADLDHIDRGCDSLSEDMPARNRQSENGH